MLTLLNINDFAIIKQLNIDFESGMNVITGETGAGKSIAIDALGLCLGYRSDVGMIRKGAEKAIVSASFTIDEDSIAYKWLENKSLVDQNQPTEITIRRVLNLSGPSKAYINEHPVTISSLKEFTQYLVHLHGQHAPQLLLKNSYQATLVDRYIGNKKLLNQVSQAYKEYKQAQDQLDEFIIQKEQNQNNKLLLEYKLRELEENKLEQNEFERLEAEFKILSNQTMIHENNQWIVKALSQGPVNVIDLLSKSIDKATTLSSFDNRYQNLVRLLDEALINITEANNEAMHLSNDDLDVDSLEQVQTRLNIYNSLARKCQVLPESLYNYFLELKHEKEKLSRVDDIQVELEQKVEEAKNTYIQIAKKLTHSRKVGAKELSDKVVDILQSLNMKGSKFYIQVTTDAHKITEYGSDDIVFMLNSNVGQDAQELSKVASGGELSRIALAIQVLTASHLDNGTLIFDEVDVGISGKTATVVGRIIRKLSKEVQVITVTHLAQVAAYATHHFQVEKSNEDDEVKIKVNLLDDNQRVLALASLIGHEDLSQAAVENARSLLAKSQQDPSIL